MGWQNYAFSIGHQMTTDWIFDKAYEIAGKPDIYDDERKPQSKITVNGKRVCPECGKELKVRTNKKTGEQFIACVGFFNKDGDRCFHTEQIDG